MNPGCIDGNACNMVKERDLKLPFLSAVPGQYMLVDSCKAFRDLTVINSGLPGPNETFMIFPVIAISMILIVKSKFESLYDLWVINLRGQKS